MNSKVFISVILMFAMTSLSDARTVQTPTDDEAMLRKTVEVVVVVDKHAYSQWRHWQLNGTSTSSSSSSRRSSSRRSSSRRRGGTDDGNNAIDVDQQTEAAIIQFINATFLSANLIWKGMEEHGLALDLRIDNIIIVKDDDIVTPIAGGNSVMNEVAFWDFFHWLIRNGFEFDHAVLFTGLDLTSGDISYHEGYAYMDTMCSPESVSVVENIINGIPAVVFAHEVGHSLSARHDGGRNNRCNSTSGYIMNANNIGVSPNHWRYSSCSANAIRSKLHRLEQSYDCLSEDSTRAPEVESPYLGQIYTGDQLCQMSQGNHSYVCRHLYNRPNSRGICQILYCLVNATYCAGLAPVDGLPCAAGKRCLAGQCVPFDDVPEDVTDLCYTGDKPGLAWRDQTCGEVVASYTHLCKDQWYQDFCCSTCRRFHTGRDACPYGNAHNRCALYYCGTRWEGECCETCPP